MRLIGHLPDEPSATTFSNVLVGFAIEHQIEPENERWAVWIHAEEDFEVARKTLLDYLSNPAAEEFEAKAREGAVRRRMQAEDAAGERVLNAPELLRATLPYGVGALTAVLVGICTALVFVSWAGYQDRVFDELLIARIVVENNRASWSDDLREIFQQGEFWRLITPALVHFGSVHFLVNMICLLDLGSAIEGRQGTGRLGFLFLCIGIGSNLAQFSLGGPNFWGISGVLYGLLGYIWMKGKFDPASGLYLHPYTVVLMLVFFFLGIGGAFSNVLGVSVPNSAHAAGLILGVCFGLLNSWREIRQRFHKDAGSP